MIEEEAAALRSELETVRAENKQLKESAGLEKIEASYKAELKSVKSELDTVLAENKTLKEAVEAQRVEAINREADALIEAAIRDHKIAPKNEKEKENLKNFFLFNKVAATEFIESMQPNPAFKTVVNVNASAKDIGKAPGVKDTNSMSSNTGKLCEAAVKEYQASHPGISFSDAWKIQAAIKPEIFAGANS